jgi:uncharacterized protein
MNHLMKLAVVALILSMGMILSASILSKFFLRVRHEQAITVKGYAATEVTSDIGQFSSACTVRGTSLKDAYDKLKGSRSVTLSFLKQIGLRESEIVTHTIEIAKISKRDAQGKEMNEIEYYDVSQRFTVTSTNVALIRDTASRITELIQEDVDIQAAAPQFMVSDMKDIKLRLLAEATEDGYRRALALARGSKGRIGALISAQQGVFQITERHSTDTSGAGEYDTSSIEKSAKAVVTLEYAIEPNS